MRRSRLLLVAASALSVSGCGPKISAELIAGRTVMITNGGDETLTIERIVANRGDGRSECVDAPGAVLSSGRSYTTTFFYCGQVRRVEVETSRGRREIDFD